MNKKIIIYLAMVLILLTSVTAINYDEYFTGGNDLGTASINRADGMTFYVNCTAGYTPYLLNISLQTDTAANFAYIYQYNNGNSGDLMATSSNISGDQIYFGDLQLNNTEHYHVAGNLNGAAGAYNMDRVETIPALNVSQNGGGYVVRGFKSDANPPTGSFSQVFPTQINNFQGFSIRCEPSVVLPTFELKIDTPINGTEYGFVNLQGNNSIINFTFTTNESGIAGVGLNDTRFTLQSNTSTVFRYTNNTELGVGFYHVYAFANKTGFINVTNATIFSIDYIFPQIDTNFTNDRVYIYKNLTAQFNITDDFSLFSYNISVDGTNIQSKQGISSTLFHANFSYDISALSVGEHNLSIRVADGHTKAYIEPYKQVKKGFFNNYLEYTFNDDKKLKISAGLLDTWDTEKQNDRYTFDFKPFSKKNSYDFTVETDDNIYLMDVPNTPWKKWLVVGDHWLDFYTGDENIDYDFDFVNSKKVKVKVKNFKGTEELIKFKSIGDLNIIQQNYTFYVSNVTIEYQAEVNELQLQTIEMRINLTGTLNETNATLTYNGSNRALIKTSFANYDRYVASFTTPTQPSTPSTVPFIFDIQYTSNITQTQTINNNQTVYTIGVDNCSVHTTTAINITIINETGNNEIDGFMAGYFEVFVNDSSQFRPFNLTWATGNKRGICISPENLTYITNGQLEYGASGFTTKTYYFTNVQLDKTTENLNLYLTEGSTAVTIIVNDENDDPVQGAFVSILSYDFATDTFITTEIIETDTNGQGIANMILNTQWYKFIVTFGGEVVLETQSTKILTTTQTLRVTIGDVYLEKFSDYVDVGCGLSFTNATGNFAFTFSDPSGNTAQGCLEVLKKTIHGDMAINESCVSSSSGTILVNIGTVTEDTYIGYGKVTVDGEVFLCAVNSVGFDNTYKKFGDEGIFAAFLITLSLVMVGIWLPQVAVFMSIIGVVMSVILGVFHLSWSVLISFAIAGIINIIKLNQDRK